MLVRSVEMCSEGPLTMLGAPSNHAAAHNSPSLGRFRRERNSYDRADTSLLTVS